MRKLLDPLYVAVPVCSPSKSNGSVRVPTADDKAWRFDEIERAAEFYDCNRADAIAFACGDVPQLVDAIVENDLTQDPVE